MWQVGQKFWKSYPFTITTSAFLASVIFNSVFFGFLSVLPLGVVFIFAVCIVARSRRIYLDMTHTHQSVVDLYKSDLEIVSSRSRHAVAMAQLTATQWFHRYLDARQDRAAIFRALTAIHPAGYRKESYVIERPLTMNVTSSSDLHEQLFLYIDLPEDVGLATPQLRFVISERERQIIGALPEYDKARVTLLEADSEQSLRQYLAIVAYEQLKENADGPAVLVTE